MAVNDRWLTDLAAHVANLSGMPLGAGVFYGQVPEEWDPATLGVVLMPRPGGPPDRSGGMRFPAVQIVHRAKAFLAAWEAAVALSAALDQKRPQRLGSSPNWTLLNRIAADGEPYVLGQDSNHCWLIASNYTLTLTAA